MITFNPASWRVAQPDPTAAGSPMTGPNDDPAGFASLLRQRQATPQPVAPQPMSQPPAPESPEPVANPSDSAASQAPKGEAPKAADAAPAPPPAPRTAENEAAARSRASAKGGKARDPGEARDAAAGADAPATDPNAAAAPAKPVNVGSGAATSPTDPTLMPWLGMLPRAVETPVGAPAAGTAEGAGETNGRGAPGAPAPIDARPVDANARDLAQQQALLGPDPRDAKAFETVLLAQRQDTAPAAASHDAQAIGDTAAAGAAAVGSMVSPTTGTTPAAAAANVAIATPVTAPDFAQELGLRLSVLAKDGVSQAELHLNPADMGPVSVQITMDGSQAHIAFGADLAATRQAIESGLPQLASALADAGFTLAGGGVSQHAGERSGQDGSGSPDRQPRGQSASASAVAQVGSAARRIVRQGGLDLFA